MRNMSTFKLNILYNIGIHYQIATPLVSGCLEYSHQYPSLFVGDAVGIPNVYQITPIIIDNLSFHFL